MEKKGVVGTGKSADTSSEERGNEINAAKLEMELLMQKVKVLKLEKELIKKEKQLKLSDRRISFSIVKEMLPQCEDEVHLGEWIKQLEGAFKIYNLDDKMKRMLLVCKLKGRLRTWLFSRPDHLIQPVDVVIQQMQEVFSCQDIELHHQRRKFLARRWIVSESFTQYYNDKISLASAVQFKEVDLVDYIIEGIPDEQLRIQAYSQRFSSKSQLLHAFSEMELKRKSSVTEKSLSSSVSMPRLKKRSRLYNRNLSGRFASNRRKSMGANVACFACGKLGIANSTSQKTPEQLPTEIDGARTSQVSGSVLINGRERNLHLFRKLSCYIMQDDVLFANLTVREAMMIAANLKFGKDFDKTAKFAIVNEILETIGLIKSSNVKTCNISGGQRKRLSIALELVNNPPVMFLDEPTSGLDSSVCYQLISLLKSLTQGGRTIICTIHQPSARVLGQFDHLYLLAQGQRMYEGAVSGLVPFLSTLGYKCPAYHNPADFAMEVATGEYGDLLTKIAATDKSSMRNFRIQKDNRLALVNKKGIENNFVKGNNNKSKIKDQISLVDETGLEEKPDESSADSGLYKLVNLTSQQSKPSNNTIIPISTNNVSIYDVSEEDRSCYLKSSKEHQPTSGATEITCNASFHESMENNTILSNKTGYPTTGWQQFWILLKRSLITMTRDSMLIQTQVISHVVIGILIGLMFYDIGNDASKVMNNTGCLFFTLLFAIFSAMMPTILTFPIEMSVFVREHLNYWYSLKAFYFAKTIVDIPFQILLTTVYCMVIYYLTSQPMELQRISMFITICVLTSLVAQTFGLLIGAAMQIQMCVFIGPVSTLPNVLFSGFIATFDTLPNYLRWLTYVNYMRYGFEGTAISIYGMNRPPLQCNDVYCHFANPKKFLKVLSMDTSEYWVDVVVLIFIIVTFRVMVYFVLRWKLKSIH